MSTNKNIKSLGLEKIKITKLVNTSVVKGGNIPPASQRLCNTENKCFTIPTKTVPVEE
ncbi:hypothetical protein IWQ47_001500 [Aquimarina sp. EL_43]|uniref:hypothetical protein n=1 Tax=Aquimarina TaxID=290174 RepID=UPI0004ADFD3A|nr:MULTISPECIES: hypothetical protein [Aquimarina]MBG6130417.1 hypothetical protein [Aquimarina sp. EL_35]MBG6149197.1 hypothetical protein [Aquimarina sp. EL_32]MBG6168429.1 hypothetical protein [Aquimarina sp. EL_43]